MSDSSDDKVYQKDEHHYDNDPDTEDQVLASDDGEDSYNASDSENDDDDNLPGGLIGNGKNKYSRFKIEQQKDDMASDSQAWAQDKKHYYNTDFFDKYYKSKFCIFFGYFTKAKNICFLIL